MHRIAYIQLIATALIYSPLAVLAVEQPSTQFVPNAPPVVAIPVRSISQTAVAQTHPADDITTPDSNAPGNEYATEHPTTGRGRAGQRLSTYSNSEIDAAMQFTQINSPNRYKILESLPDSDRKMRIKNVATRAYLQVMRAKDEPDLYNILIKRTQIEDEVFGLVGDLKKAGVDNEGDKQDAVKSQLRDKVSDLVKIGIKERHLRLAILQRTVEAEQKQLALDSAHPEILIEDRLRAILNSSGKGLDSGLGGGSSIGIGGGAIPRSHGGPHEPGRVTSSPQPPQ